MVLERMQLERMRLRLHGADSSLKLLKEQDRDLTLLRTLETHFTVTRQREPSLGGYVERLTAKLLSEAAADDFAETNVVDLVVGDRTTRYRLDSKNVIPQQTAVFGLAELTMMKNERTAIV